jgi:hypothetical protein
MLGGGRERPGQSADRVSGTHTGKSTIVDALERWLRWKLEVRVYYMGSKSPSRYAYRVVRHETLVTRPEETMREVCVFLDEEFDATMLGMKSARRYRAQREAAVDGSPISTVYVGRYRQTINRHDLAFIQAFSSRQMLAFDYTPDPLRLSPSERFHFAAVGWPVNLARMGSWRAMDALFRRPRPSMGQPAAGR